MPSAPLPADESGRLQLLRELRILDTPAEEAFDSIVRLAQRQLGCPMAALTLVDHERCWIKAGIGLPVSELPRETSFGARVIVDGGLLEVADCRVDARFVSHPLVDGAAGVRFYAGAPIVLEGHAIGVLSALDGVARTFDESSRRSLLDFTCLAQTLLAHRLKERRMRLQTARLRGASLSSSDCLWETDRDGRVTWVSDGALAHSGLAPGTAQDAADINLRNQTDGTDSWHRYQASLNRREPFKNLISDRIGADGSLVTTSMSGVPVFDSRGEFRGYRGATSNITERKLVELALATEQQALRESQQRLSAVLEAVPDLWFVLDAEGRYLECSSADHPMLTHDWQQLRRRNFREGIAEPTASAALETIRLALASGRVQRHEYALTTRDGMARWFEARVSPMPGGKVLYVTRDLTELRSLERELMIMKRALEAAAALPLCVTDARLPDMPMIYINPAFETLTGYPRHELIGRNCRFLQGGRSDQPGVAQLREAIRNQRECSVLLENVRKDGVAFTNSLHVAPVFGHDGELTHYIGVMSDVTEQSRAADKLRLSEELYRSVALAISDGLVVVTPALEVVAVNPAGASVLGVEQRAFQGYAGAWPFEFLDEQARPLADGLHPVHQVLRSGAPLVDQVYALRRPDGELRWLELNAHPLQVRPEGGAFSVMLTFRDVTRQRAAEQALVAAEERWKFALEGSGDGVWDWDIRTNKVFYSPRWKKMMGYAEDEIGESVEEWTSRIHPDDLPQMMSELRRHLRGETPFYQSEHRVRHRDGSELWILDRGKAVGHSADGRPLRVVGTHSDITSGKQAEQALRDKQAAELASLAKSQFLSRMSHEMRTPLNAVIGFAQLMLMMPGGTHGRDMASYADHVLHAGQHLLALINDVLDLQKVEEGGLSLAIGPVALHDTVAGALELLSPLAQGRQVRFDNQLGPGLWVRADAQRLRQVVLNIVSNAIKYNHIGGAVRFSVDGASPPGRLALVVEDSGAGMSQAQMSRLFQPFERLGKETSAIEGTGLGLIIARSLTQAIGGKLDVSSLPGKGTRVRIELQCDDAPDRLSDTPPPLLTESDDTVVPTSPPLRMLYVEDNRINAILFEGALRMHNSHVELRVAEDGEEAVAIAREWAPEVLVLDAHLPGMSGFEVLQQLRRLPGLATVPAYMCSADAMPEDVQRAYEAGFVGYWTKPIDISAVLADIDELAGRLRMGT